MKIYNKKVFASGVFEMAMGLLLLITSIMRQDLDINSIILIVALFAFGFGSIMRSISQRMAKVNISRYEGHRYAFEIHQYT